MSNQSSTFTVDHQNTSGNIEHMSTYMLSKIQHQTLESAGNTTKIFWMAFIGHLTFQYKSS